MLNISEDDSCSNVNLVMDALNDEKQGALKSQDNDQHADERMGKDSYVRTTNVSADESSEDNIILRLLKPESYASSEDEHCIQRKHDSGKDTISMLQAVPY